MTQIELLFSIHIKKITIAVDLEKCDGLNINFPNKYYKLLLHKSFLN